MLPRAATVMLSPQMPKDTVEARAAKSPNNPVGSVMPAKVIGALPSPTITPLILTLGFTPPSASHPAANASFSVPVTVKPTSQTLSDPVGMVVLFQGNRKNRHRFVPNCRSYKPWGRCNLVQWRCLRSQIQHQHKCKSHRRKWPRRCSCKPQRRCNPVLAQRDQADLPNGEQSIQ